MRRTIALASASVFVVAMIAGTDVALADIAVVEGQQFAGRVVDAPGCEVTTPATISWGDGATSPGSPDAADAQGVQGVQGIHTYAEEGSFTASATYTCPNFRTQQTTRQFVATVRDAPLTSAGRTVSASSGQSASVIVAHFDDGNPGATADDFSAQIDWGDGSSSAGSVTAAAGGGFDVAGTHTYVTAGSYAVSTSIADVGGSVASATSTAEVVTPSPPANQTRPSVEGVPKAGQSLTCNPGTWLGAPSPTFTYDWQAFYGISFPIDNIGTGRSITLIDLPPGALVHCVVHATNQTGMASATSDPVTVLPTAPELADFTFIHVLGRDVLVRLVPRPSITSDVGFGGTNLCTTGTWLHWPNSYSYTWYIRSRIGTKRGHFHFRAVGHHQTLKIQESLENKFLFCRVDASNAAGTTSVSTNGYVVPQNAPVPRGAVHVQVSTSGPSHPPVIDPPIRKSDPLRASTYMFTCFAPRFNRRVSISIHWEVNSSVSGFYPFGGVFPGDSLSIDARGRPAAINGTPIPGIRHLDGTVRCVVTARLRNGVQADVFSQPIYVFGLL